MPKRDPSALRTVEITPHYVEHPEGSALVAFGDTRVLCTASVDETVPRWLKGQGKGWVTGEYDMLPRATGNRRQRDSHRGKINGRTQEISRLIGRALRSVVDMTAFGERSITVDCDVIQADGGTRTAAITGGYVALAIALQNLIKADKAKPEALKGQVAAVSVGVLAEGPALDLDYSMDVRAHVDMNVVMTDAHELVELQGTGEAATFKRGELNELLDLAFGALPTLLDVQKRAIAVPFSKQPTVVTA